MDRPSPTLGEQRYLRQGFAFPQSRRETTLLVDLCAGHAAVASAFLKAGGAAMGVPILASDFHGPTRPSGHWFLGGHDCLAATINPEKVTYEPILPGAPAMALGCLAPGRENAWLVVHLNSPNDARAALEAIAGFGVLGEQLRVLLALAGPAGIVVQRAPNVAAALDLMRTIPDAPIPAGSTELSMLAAGVCLNELVFGGVPAQDDLNVPRVVAFYSLRRPRRVDYTAGTDLGRLVAEVASPAGDRPSFSGRRVKQVGAGALGNWTSIAIALDASVTMEVVDGDPTVEAHNLNRQVLLVNGLGRPKAPVLRDELAQLDPQGSYTAVVRFAREKRDLGPLEGTDLLLSVPDNNAARVLCADAAHEAALLFGQGGTGATGGQETVHAVGRACFHCVVNSGESSGETPRRSNSCAAVAEDSIVSSNMALAGLLVSELREAVAGRRVQNVRFVGDGAQGNKLGRMITHVACPHAAATRPAPVEAGKRESVKA